MTALDLCPHGCYWECEHRPPGTNPDRAALRPVEDEHGRLLMRCQECGEFIGDLVSHSREHIRMRQLGWLPERLPVGWYR